ncbi:MAG: tetratricopeptide repeat protein [Polyangiaceae bacterium]|nr:tetratricopeptide repeat protein [Polyangiaceae bacterium]
MPEPPVSVESASVPEPPVAVEPDRVSEPLSEPEAVSSQPVDTRAQQAREVVEACQQELSASWQRAGVDPYRGARLHYEIARLLEAPLGDLDGAVEHYQKAHALWPEHIPTLRGARRVLTRKGNLQAVLPLFDVEVRRASDPRHKARVLYEKGLLLEHRLGDRQRAREAFRAAVNHDDSNAALLVALERVERQAESWRDLDRTYERTSNVATGDPRYRAALLCQRARLAEVRDHDDKAATELYQAALEVDPKVLVALHGLKRLYYSGKRWGELIGVLRLECDCAADSSVRAMANYRIGRIYVDALGKLDEGIQALEQAIQETPDDRMVLEELARLYERAARPRQLVGALERLVSLSGTSGTESGLLHRIAQLYEEQLDDADSAIRWYEKELALDPTYIPALQALGRVYGAREKWQQLADMLRAEAEATGAPQRRAAAYARLAEVLEVRLGQAEAAAVEHARALAAVPGYAPSFEALSRLYTAAGRFHDLVTLYETAVDNAEDDETRITYLFKIGRLHEESLELPAEAVLAYRRILDIKPDHVGALHAIQRTAERAGRYQELVDALEREACSIADPRRIVALYHRAGEILEEKLEDAEGALLRYRKVIGIDAKYAPALASLGRAHYYTGRWEELIDVYRQELRLSTTAGQAAGILYKIGEICGQRLGRDDEAIAAYRQALERDSQHAPSRRALSNRLEKLGQWAELVKVVEFELASITSDELRARTLFRLGELYENRLSQPVRALGAYDQALKAVPGFRPALDGRARLLAQAGDWERLVKELSREAEASADPVLWVAALLREGEVWRDELGNPEQAIRCYEAVLSREPSHVGALLALEQLYADAKRYKELVGVFEMQARVVTDVGARIAALRELARLQEAEELASPEQVRQTLYAILQLDPNDAGALGELERLALAEGDQQLMAHVDANLAALANLPEIMASHHTRLAEALESNGDRAALRVYRAALASDPDNFAATRGLSRLAEHYAETELLEQAAEGEARVTHDLGTAARLLLKAASLHAEAGNAEGATVAVLRALELHPDHPETATRLCKLLTEAGDVERLIQALSHAALTARSKDRVIALWLEVANLQSEAKQSVPAALATLRRVTQLAPSHVQALTRQAELYVRDGQWVRAVKRFEKALSSGAAEEQTTGIHRELARICDQKLSDKERALASLRQVLSRVPDDGDVLRRVFEIQLEVGDPFELGETAARLVAVTQDEQVRALALGHMARTEREQGKHGDALNHYEQVVGLVGLGPLAADFRGLVEQQPEAERSAGFARYVRALMRYLEGSRAPEQVADVCEELARVFASELSDHEQALTVLRRAVGAAPERSALHGDIARLLKLQGQLHEAAAELRLLIDADVNQVDAWRELSDLFAAMQRPIEATLALEPVVAMGAATETEAASVGARRARATEASVFDDASFRLIDAVGTPDIVGDLVAPLGDVLPKLYPPELERYGLSARERIGARANHPLRTVSERVARVLGVTDFDLYLSQADGLVPRVELTDPLGLVLPEEATGFTEKEQAFLVARLLCNIARRLHIVDRLSPRELEVLLAAAGRNAQPGYGSGLTDDETLNALARRVSKSTPWVRRRAVDDAALRFTGTADVDASGWHANVRRTAAFAAVVIVDDLVVATDMLRRYESGAEESEAGVDVEEFVRDLMLFWVSESAFAVRRRLGIL